MRLHFIRVLVAIFSLIGSVAHADISSDFDVEDVYGIRHDRELSDYEEVAAGATKVSVPDFSPVVFFDYSLDGADRSDFIASGVLIAPYWVLTAGHNFYNASEQQAPAPPKGVLVAIGNDPNEPDAVYEVEKLIFHPTWMEGEQSYENANDLCLVRLVEPVTDIEPAILHKSAHEKLGQVVWHAGFGIYSDLPGQNVNLDSKKHAIQNTLDRIQGGLETHKNGTTYIGGLLAFDFDAPDGSINTLADDVVNKDEAFLGAGNSSAAALHLEGTTVIGDSGGPLYIWHNNQWEVAGILSGGASDPLDNHWDASYGDISIYTRVSLAHGWIQSVINAHASAQ